MNFSLISLHIHHSFLSIFAMISGLGAKVDFCTKATDEVLFPLGFNIVSLATLIDHLETKD